MLSWIREKFGTIVIGGIIGFITFVFVFYGIFTPKATRGMHEGAVAGKVNGDSISLAEFNRALAQKTEMFKNILGNGPNVDEQLKSFRLRQGVFHELVRRKLLVQEANHSGLKPSDEEVRAKIQEYPVFQDNGRFDVLTYRKVLEANNYSPEGFERLIREDLAAEQWSHYFKNRIQVSEEEARRQFTIQENKRNVKYVLLNADTGKKGVQVSSDEMQKFLKDPAKLNIVKMQFESKKNLEFKGKPFESVQEQLAREVLAGEKIEEIHKVNEKLALEILPLLQTDKKADGRVNEMLKSYGVQVKETGLFSRQGSFVPGVGESKELIADAFSKKSPINTAQGGKPKKYASPTWIAVAVVVDEKSPDMARFSTERQKIVRQIAGRKERDIFDSWIKNLMDKAKIDPNPDVVNDV